jgi:hypothetical protein
MRRLGLLLLLLPLLVVSCEAVPEPLETELVQPEKTAEPAETVQDILPPTPTPAGNTAAEPAALSAALPAAEKAVEEKVFDPSSISEEKFATTKADIQALIAELNRIIRARNYFAWLGYLSAEYLDQINSAGFLEERTEELYRRDQIVAANMGRDPRMVEKRILRTPRDYFENVVVPSRTNDRVDDIAYVSEDHIKAYTMDSRGQRLVLYELAQIDDKWKINN